MTLSLFYCVSGILTVENVYMVFECSGLLDLWLVTDILYAEKITTEARTSSLSGA